jgi:hypothetical protein
MNDTTKTSVVAFAEANTTTDQNLAQICTIMNYEKQVNGLFFGADLIGCVSTEFGVVCPTYDVRAGFDFQNGSRIELKCGNFTRNSVKTAGFDPQFSNFCTMAGDPASVAKAVQIGYTKGGTKILIGHQAGSEFYKFNDGNYYIAAEQRIGNFAVSGGADFTEKTTGYAAANWSCGNNVINLNCNKLGSDNQNFILSYNHNNISLGKGVMMNVGSALYVQPAKTGLHMVAGFCKSNYKLFAQAGAYTVEKTVKPLIGLGLNVKL